MILGEGILERYLKENFRTESPVEAVNIFLREISGVVQKEVSNTLSRDLDLFEVESIENEVMELGSVLLTLINCLDFNERQRAFVIIDIFIRSYLDKIKLNVQRRHGKDDLTGLRSSKYARDLFSSEKSFLINNPDLLYTLAVVRIDIDNFKKINDSGGHAYGDFVLRTIAESLNEVLRLPGQMAFRVGGDEFLAVVGRIPYDFGERVMRKIYDDFIARFSFKFKSVYPNKDIPTFSSGIFVLEPNDEVDFDTADMNADSAAYDVKQNGKNNLKFCD
jgi:diguanylate cyclase (GGDEF)-like protein